MLNSQRLALPRESDAIVHLVYGKRLPHAVTGSHFVKDGKLRLWVNLLVSVLGASRLCAASFVRLEFEIVWNLISKAWFPNPCQPFQITVWGASMNVQRSITTCATASACEAFALVVRWLVTEAYSHSKNILKSLWHRQYNNDNINVHHACKSWRAFIARGAAYSAQLRKPTASWNHHETSYETTRFLPHCWWNRWIS